MLSGNRYEEYSLNLNYLHYTDISRFADFLRCVPNKDMLHISVFRGVFNSDTDYFDLLKALVESKQEDIYKLKGVHSLSIYNFMWVKPPVLPYGKQPNM